MDLDLSRDAEVGTPRRLLDLAVNGESGLRHYFQAPST